MVEPWWNFLNFQLIAQCKKYIETKKTLDSCLLNLIHFFNSNGHIQQLVAWNGKT